MRSERSRRQALPAQIMSLGMCGMVTSALILLTAMAITVLGDMSARNRAALDRAADIAVHLAAETADPTDPASVFFGLHALTRAELALYRGDRAVASTSFDGADLIGTVLSPAVRQSVLREGRRLLIERRLGPSIYVLCYVPLRDRHNHVVGALVLGLPTGASSRAALQRIGLLAVLAAATVLLLGLAFRHLGRKLTASVLATEQALDRTNSAFSAALEGISHGFAIYDAEGVLMASNARFAALLGADPAAIRPGITLRDVLLTHATFDGPDDPQIDEFVATRLREIKAGRGAKVTVRGVHNRPVLVTECPIAGGGWLAFLEDPQEQERSYAQAQFLKQYDNVTMLPNRDHLHHLLQAGLDLRLEGSGGAAHWPALLKIDILRLKVLTDSFGAEIVDKLLNEIKRRLLSCLRDTDVLARVRMDEFAVLPGSATSRTEAAALATRLLARINGSYQIDGTAMSVTANVGIALAPEHGTCADELLKTASIASQLADGQAGCWRIFEPEMEGALSTRLALEADLAQALAADQLELFYQPLIDLRSNRISCFEALLRWRHPRRGMVSPVDFIPIAEETGLIVEIGAWVLRQACHDAMAWPCDIRVAVNLSAMQLRQAQLPATVEDALARSGLAAGRLELEVTETVLLEGNHAALRIMHALRALGARISMDDFGTGHSSLSYLRDFPFDKIKIDKSFVEHMLVRDDCLSIIRAVTSLAGSLHISVTAEGAETAEQIDRLRLEGCTEVQGFYYSRPKPIREIKLLLEQRATEVA